MMGALEFFYYRRDVFAERNLTVPRTWDELLEVAEKLNGG